MNKKIKIGKRWIGDGEPVFIIAEAGSNHNKKLGQAMKLIDVASQSGADAVKFQLFKAEKLYRKGDPAFDVVKANELPREWVNKLAGYSRKKGLIFLASPFDTESVDLLYSIGVQAYKCASSETVNLPLLRYIASKKKPVIISTAMCNLADVYEAVEAVFSTGNENVALLQCTSLYPAAPHDVNLRVMDTLGRSFGVPVGYSDHTLGITMPIGAVARGACVIEKHFTLSRGLKGPDHFYALEPDEFKQMVIAIREVEQGLGSAIKMMLPEEKKCARRNSLIAKKDIPKGTKLAQDMIVINRPALGIEPRFLDAVIGQKTKRQIKKDEAITWESIGGVKTRGVICGQQ
jgi:sialic acid synthase SpsE